MSASGFDRVTNEIRWLTEDMPDLHCSLSQIYCSDGSAILRVFGHNFLIRRHPSEIAVDRLPHPPDGTRVMLVVKYHIIHARLRVFKIRGESLPVGGYACAVLGSLFGVKALIKTAADLEGVVYGNRGWLRSGSGC